MFRSRISDSERNESAGAGVMVEARREVWARRRAALPPCDVNHAARTTAASAALPTATFDNHLRRIMERSPSRRGPLVSGEMSGLARDALEVRCGEVRERGRECDVIVADVVRAERERERRAARSGGVEQRAENRR